MLHEPSRVCPLVRRTTGGGAIIHDQELTYSFTCHAPHREGSNSLELYDAFHSTLVEELATLGISAALCPEILRRDEREEPFLCFERRSQGDVLIGDAKIAGSAQRRHKNALLQHGSVLLRKSISAPELEGIEGISGIRMGYEELARRWASRVGTRLGLPLAPETPSEEEHDATQRLTTEKFANRGWTCRR